MAYLHYEVLNSDLKSNDKKIAVFLHGILGVGKNLKTFAKLFLKNFPDYVAYLIDSPNHGQSPDLIKNNLGVNYIDLCAQELERLFNNLRIKPDILIGHSYGGKIAMGYAELISGNLEQVWSLDSFPNSFKIADANTNNSKNFSAFDVLRVLGKLPKNFVSRNEFVKLALETGMPKSIALFLTLSLKNQDETKNLGWKFNLRVLKTMLEDFEKKDLMGFLNSEAAHANNCQYHVVQAEKNSRWQGKVLKEVQELYKTHKITLHYLKGAGHWVHTDNPEGILEFMRQANGRV